MDDTFAPERDLNQGPVRIAGSAATILAVGLSGGLCTIVLCFALTEDWYFSFWSFMAGSFVSSAGLMCAVRGLDIPAWQRLLIAACLCSLSFLLLIPIQIGNLLIMLFFGIQDSRPTTLMNLNLLVWFVVATAILALIIRVNCEQERQRLVELES